MRLSLVISSLAPGGAEKILALLANSWAARGHDVTLLTISSQAGDRQLLHPAVRRVALDLLRDSRNALQALRGNLERTTRLRAEIDRAEPDVVISFLSTTNVLTLAATRWLGVRVLVSERIDPRHEPISPFWRGTRALLYPSADGIVVQTPAVGEWALRFVGPDKVHVIPNPVIDGDAGRSDGRSPRPEWLAADRPVVFAAGRLTRQKGFDILLRAFARCHAAHPEWRLVVLGEGEERCALAQQARQLGLETAVALPGHVPAASVLRFGDLFVLSSRYEGFPNALLDAMNCGLPVIAADCPSGPRQIVRDGIDGVLVEPENVDSLSAAMERMMADAGLRSRLASRAVDVRERFSVSRVLHAWDALLEGRSRES